MCAWLKTTEVKALTEKVGVRQLRCRSGLAPWKRPQSSKNVSLEGEVIKYLEPVTVPAAPKNCNVAGRFFAHRRRRLARMQPANEDALFDQKAADRNLHRPPIGNGVVLIRAQRRMPVCCRVVVGMGMIVIVRHVYRSGSSQC